MIKGVHTMFYSSQPDELRAFLRDKLGFPFTDVGQGWLIFDLPEADMGCHPTEPGTSPPSGTADISFYCDDINQTVAELRERGVETTGEIADQGYGLVTHFRMPGDIKVQLYQPRYAKRAAAAASPAQPRKAPKSPKKKSKKKTRPRTQKARSRR